jgi:hypothetical protein
MLDRAPPVADLIADLAIWRASHDVPDTSSSDQQACSWSDAYQIPSPPT